MIFFQQDAQFELPLLYQSGEISSPNTKPAVPWPPAPEQALCLKCGHWKHFLMMVVVGNSIQNINFQNKFNSVLKQIPQKLNIFLNGHKSLKNIFLKATTIQPSFQTYFQKYELRKCLGFHQLSQNRDLSAMTGGARTELGLTSTEQETSVKCME